MAADQIFDITMEVLPVAADGADAISDCCPGSSRIRSHIKLALNIILLLLTAIGIITESIGFAEFLVLRENITTFSLVESNHTDTTWKLYEDFWAVGIAGLLVGELSNLLLTLYSIKQMKLQNLLCCRTTSRIFPSGIQCSRDNKRAQKIIYWGQKLTFFFQFIFEDCIVSFTKIAIALKSPEAQALLRTRAEQIACIACLSVAGFQLILAAIPVARSLSKLHCSPTLVWNAFVLFCGCIATASDVLTMLISLSILEIDHDDHRDFIIILLSLL